MFTLLYRGRFLYPFSPQEDCRSLHPPPEDVGDVYLFAAILTHTVTHAVCPLWVCCRLCSSPSAAISPSPPLLPVPFNHPLSSLASFSPPLSPPPTLTNRCPTSLFSMAPSRLHRPVLTVQFAQEAHGTFRHTVSTQQKIAITTSHLIWWQIRPAFTNKWDEAGWFVFNASLEEAKQNLTLSEFEIRLSSVPFFFYSVTSFFSLVGL